MPYYFECTYCNARQDIHEGDWGFALNCDFCGEDICEMCAKIVEDMPLCGQCYTKEVTSL